MVQQMNTERLFEFLDRLTTEAKSLNLNKKLNELSSNSTNMVNQPQVGSYQTAFSTVLDSLEQALHESWFGKMTPFEAEVLSSIDLEALEDGKFVRDIRQTLAASSVLPAVLQETVSTLNNNIKTGLQKAENARDSLKELGFEAEEVEKGVGEIALRIPRNLIDENFDGFINDASFFNDLIATTSEIVLGEPTQLKLRSIASSDYAIFLEMLPEIVGFTVLAIERVMNGYKTLLEIKVLKQQLASREVPEELTDHIQKDIDKRLDEVARKGAEEAIAQWETKAKKERLNELTTLAGKRLGELMTKLEAGYQLDGRVGYEDLEDDEEGAEEQNRLREMDLNVRLRIQKIRSEVIESERLQQIDFEGPTEPNDDLTE